MNDRQAMNTSHNDQLAGSMGALDMMERVRGMHAYTALIADLLELKLAGDLDQAVRRELIDGIGVSEALTDEYLTGSCR